MDIDRPNKEVTGPLTDYRTLQSDKPRILDGMYEKVGSQQVSRSKLEFAPSWILDEAFESEHNSNWADSYAEVVGSDVAHDANVVSSHVVYKIKTDEEGKRKLKARIVPHGNQDHDKDIIRKDSANAQLSVISVVQ